MGFVSPGDHGRLGSFQVRALSHMLFPTVHRLTRSSVHYILIFKILQQGQSLLDAGIASECLGGATPRTHD